MKVLLHPDGGKGVGLGHISRCKTLAAALVRSGHQVMIATDPRLNLTGFVAVGEVVGASCDADAEGIRKEAWDFNADYVIIDSYRWNGSDFRAVRGPWKVVAFDDEAKRELPTDVVINGAPCAPELHYDAPLYSRLLLGTAYQIIRDDFRDVPRRRPSDTVRRVVAMVGGDDPLALLPTLAEELESISASMTEPFAIDLICGPFTPLPEMPVLRHVRVLRNPPDLRDLMFASDLAVSAGGQTLYELARCGTPTIAFCTGPDQFNNLTALARANVISNTGDVTATGWRIDLASAVRVLAGDAERRAAMMRAGQKLIDGLGVDRLVSALESPRADLRAGDRKMTGEAN